jgi:lipoprotein-anchoring transpeptidase ErfK/SrfK
MKTLSLLFGCISAILAIVAPPTMAEIDGALVTIYVDKAPAGTSQTAQNMHVYHRDSSYPLMFAIVSTGRENSFEQSTSGVDTDSITPTGVFGITRMSKDHVSNLWDGAPMPFAIFFHQGYAFHGVYENYYSKLGDRASGGCVRLALYMAEDLWALVEQYGPENVKVVIYDSTDGSPLPRPFFH